MKKLMFAAILSMASTTAFADTLSDAINKIGSTTQMCAVTTDLSMYTQKMIITCDGLEFLNKQVEKKEDNAQVVQTFIVSRIMQKGLRLINCETTLSKLNCYLSR